MKKLVYILFVIVLCIGCNTWEYKSVVKKYHPIKEDKETSFEDLSIEEQNKVLDSLTAKGEAIIVRGSDREYDTIIDHIRYKYIKEE